MSYPADYKYTKEHEWIDVDGKFGTVGITDYAQNSLGDIVFVDLPKVGDKFAKQFGWFFSPLQVRVWGSAISLRHEILLLGANCPPPAQSAV